VEQIVAVLKQAEAGVPLSELIEGVPPVVEGWQGRLVHPTLLFPLKVEFLT
jgi:hypothetical protein